MSPDTARLDHTRLLNAAVHVPSTLSVLHGGTSTARYRVVNSWRADPGQFSRAVKHNALYLLCSGIARVFYGEFDGRRKKRVLIKVIGE